MRRLPSFSKVLLLAVLQAGLLYLAARSYDRRHSYLAALWLIALPPAVGYCGRRTLDLSLPGTLVSYTVLPFLAAAYLRGVPGLVLTRGAVFFVIALAPTALAWYVADRWRPPVRARR